MTPQERQLVAELFSRLSTLENERREPEAEQAIAQGLARAPHAVYALVQTVLVQDEAIKRADARIRELEGSGGAETRDEGFLGNMREALFGRRDEGRGSVPSVRPGEAPMGVPPGFRTGAAAGAASPEPQQTGGRGGSFLGTAAAAAAGVVGGALLLDSVRSMLGHQTGAQAQGALDPGAGARSPWDAGTSGGDLSREAGLGDMGRGSGPAESAPGSYGLFDAASDEEEEHPDDEYDPDFGDDSDLI